MIDLFARCFLIQKSITTTARRAIGINQDSGRSLFPALGSRADFVILHKNTSVQSVVLNPCYDRTTIKDGRVVATRVGHRWLASPEL
jgi:imidazolonepropionase-like amidohydrolase